MGFDEALKYIAGVANRLMSAGIRTALKNNLSYDQEDVGNFLEAKEIGGPQKIIQIHQAQRWGRNLVVANFCLSESLTYASPTKAFGSELDYGNVQNTRVHVWVKPSPLSSPPLTAESGDGNAPLLLRGGGGEEPSQKRLPGPIQRPFKFKRRRGPTHQKPIQQASPIE